MKLGTNEPKKLAMLGGLVLVAGYLVYSNLLSGPSESTTSAGNVPRASDAPAAAATAPPEAATTPTTTPRAVSRNRSDEFHPVLRSKRPEDRIDPTKVDPTLRRDLLAKLQAVVLAGPQRNLFQFGQAPPPKVEALRGPETKVPLKPIAAAANIEPPKPSGPPPPPPISLKYYGYSSTKLGGGKTAFFLDGEDILVAKEGDTVKRRYRLVRIGATSVVMEDTESKKQQTIPLTEEAG